jgi:hypothetical protein
MTRERVSSIYDVGLVELLSLVCTRTDPAIVVE